MKLVQMTIIVSTPVADTLSDVVLKHICDQTVKAMEAVEGHIKRTIAKGLDNYAKYTEIDISY